MADQPESMYHPPRTMEELKSSLTAKTSKVQSRKKTRPGSLPPVSQANDNDEQDEVDQHSLFPDELVNDYGNPDQDHQTYSSSSNDEVNVYRINFIVSVDIFVHCST